MTTIAYRDGVLAADSAVTGGDGYFAAVDKIFRVGERLVGMSGDLSSLCAALEWFRSGMPEQKPGLSSNFEALVIEPDGGVRWYGSTLAPIEIRGDYHAIGSGDKYAFGAMSMGATAKQAVQIACRFDTGSRGPIKALRIGGNAMAAQSKKRNKVERVMHEFKEGNLRTKSGQKVRSRDQALAIALSERRRVQRGRRK